MQSEQDYSSAAPNGPRPRALLLLGPTGSGKTPLGEQLERRGAAGQPCAHFDFGACLRAVAAGRDAFRRLTAADVEVVRASLRSGNLLEDRHFHVAAAIFRDFLARRGVRPPTLVVLNGLPRHVGQALAVDALAAVEGVVVLECDAETVRARIRRDTGGDRAGRSDDTLPEIEQKLKIFRERTLYLLDHYAALGVSIHPLRVAAGSTPDDLWRQLETRLEVGAA
jgi:adenylate kinase family enzyme